MQQPSIEVLSVKEFKKHPTVKAKQVLFPGKQRVLILDLFDKAIQLEESEALKSDFKCPSIKEFFLSLRDSGVTVCLTMQTVLTPGSKTELDPVILQSFKSLSKTFPDLFDLILWSDALNDSDNDSDMEKLSPDEKRILMLKTCTQAYDNNTQFSFISTNPSLCSQSMFSRCTPFHIFDNKSHLIEISQDEVMNQKNKMSLFEHTLKKATKRLTGKDILSQVPLAQPIATTVSPSSRRPQVASALPSTHAPVPVPASAPPRVSEPAKPKQPQQFQPQVARTEPAPAALKAAPPAKPYKAEHIKTSFPVRVPEVLLEHRPDNDSDDAYWTNKPLIPPAEKTASVPFGQWFNRHFLQPPLLTEPTSNEEITLKNFFVNMGRNLSVLSVGIWGASLKALLLIYGFDGYDPIKNEISYAEGANGPEKYTGDSLTDFSFKLFLASFFGLPSRAIKREGIDAPTITWEQIGKNFLGGLDWNYKTPQHKKRLQVVGIPVKALILVFKLITFPFKAILNGVKLITEFLPWLATSVSYVLYRLTLLSTQYSWRAMKAAYNKSYVTVPLAVGLFLLSIVLALSTVGLFAAHYACRALMIIGRAITSPKRGLLMAYAYGSELKVPFGSESVQRGIARFIGVLGAAVSLTITAITWAICFPLLINFVMNFVPPGAWLVNAFLDWQPVLNTISALKGTATTVATFLHTVFGPATAAIIDFIGVQITTSAVIAAVASPFLISLTAVADYLSDRWANWHRGGLFSLKEKTRDAGAGQGGYVPLVEPTRLSDNAPNPNPRPEVQRLGEAKDHHHVSAVQRAGITAIRGREATHEREPTPQGQPAIASAAKPGRSQFPRKPQKQGGL